MIGISSDSNQPTANVSYFMSPTEITTSSKVYNEVLLAVPNSKRKDSEFDEQLEKPQPIAIYCYDEITPNDIDAAQKLGIGIVLVETKEYPAILEGKLHFADTVNNPETSYYNSNSQDVRLGKNWLTTLSEQYNKGPGINEKEL